MKLNKISTIIGVATLAAGMVACSDDDKTYDYPGVDGQVVLAPTVNAVYTIVKTPDEYKVPAIGWTTELRTRIPATEAVSAKFEIDNSLIVAYNAENETEYVALPDGILSLTVLEPETEEGGEEEAAQAVGDAVITVAQGKNKSDARVSAVVTEDRNLLATLDKENTYIVPVRMTEVVSGDARIAVSATNVSYLTFSVSELMIDESGTSPSGTIVPMDTRAKEGWTGTYDGATEYYGWSTPLTAENGDNAYQFGTYNTDSWVKIDFTKSYKFDGIYARGFYDQAAYSPLREGAELLISEDDQNWTSLGTLTKTVSGTVTFYAPVTARYLKFIFHNGGSIATTAFSIYAL